MRIPAVFATMFLISVGAVTAEPVGSKPDGRRARSGAAGGAQVDRESTERHRLTDQPAVSRPAPGADGWVELADPTPSKHGKEFIPVGAAAGSFTRLRVDAHSGRLYVQTVRIDFQDGGRKLARLDTKLTARGAKAKRSAYIDLGGPREIRQIVVITDRDVKGTYTVHASADSPSVAKR